jgi:prophage DNA circulation protein
MKSKTIDIGRTKSSGDFSLHEINRRMDQMERDNSRVLEKSQSSKLWKSIESIEEDQTKIFDQIEKIEDLESKFKKLERYVPVGGTKSNSSHSLRKEDKKYFDQTEKIENLEMKFKKLERSMLADETKSNASHSSRKDDRKLNKKIILEIEAVRKELVTHQDQLNTCDESFQEIENLKENVGKVKNMAQKSDLKRLASDMQDLKTKVIEPLTKKCSKLILEMAKVITE